MLHSQDIRVLSDAELAQALEDTHQELMNLRFRAATRQLADVSQVQKSRHTIARIKTIMHERVLTRSQP